MDNRSIQENLAQSLTGEGTEIIPFLPYLLQDFWELGSDPELITSLLREQVPEGEIRSVLDLACGKGAVSIRLAKALGVRAKGLDLMPEFIREARQKAREHGVQELCTFQVEDVHRAVKQERGYDCVVWGAAGDLLGDYRRTVAGLAATVRPGGWLVIDDAYVRAPEDNRTLRWQDEYLTREEWKRIFREAGLELVAQRHNEAEEAGDWQEDFANIRRRAEELARIHPRRKKLFEDYVAGQRAEYEDLDSVLVGVLWLLKKRG